MAGGQARLLWSGRPLADVVADPETPPSLREQLELVVAARRFADELGLRVGDQYTRYVAWPGDRLVTAVVATQPGSVDPRAFWFPIVGHVPYKGFFDEGRAREEAQELREEGLDTCLVPVPAYSTLGWMADPVTTPLLQLPPGRLVETVLHELVHATVFVKDAAEFNEGIATFVGQEGAVLFFAEREGPASPRARAERARIEDDRAVARALGALRQRVAELYASEPTGPAREAARARLEAEARTALAALPLQTRDARSLARRVRLNDACLALSATYQGELEAYELRLAALGHDLRAFIAAARVAADTPDPRSVLLAPAQSPLGAGAVP